MHDEVQGILKGLLNSMGIDYKDISHIEVAGQKVVMITADDSKSLIGSHGDTIHAIDFLVKKIVEKNASSPDRAPEEPHHFLIDVNEFRTRQIRDLETKALMMAERARSFQYDVELNPMSAYERLIVHTALQNAPHVKTESQGEGRGRRVVIRYTAE